MKSLQTFGITILSLAFNYSFAQETPTTAPTTETPITAPAPDAPATPVAPVAQETPDTSKPAEKYITGGIRVGANQTDIEGIHPDAKSQINPSGGGFLNYHINESIGLGLELLYTPETITYETKFQRDSSTFDLTEAKLSFHYVQLPFYLMYSFPVSETIKPKVYAGLSFSARVKSNLYTKFERHVGDSIAVSRETDDSNVAFKYSPVDIGFIGGIGLDYWISDHMFASFDARYTRSLNDLSEMELNSSDAIRTINIGAFLSVGWKFGTK
jgi:outer membrane protein W